MSELLRVIVVLSLLSNIGCMVPVAPTLDEQHAALQLIDNGTALLRAQQIDEAEAAFQVAYELHSLPQAVDGLGCAAFLRGDFERAENLFRRAFQIDAGYVDALAHLALLFELQGDRSAAQLLYSRVITYDPRNTQARNNFSALLFDKKRLAEARTELLMAQAVTQNPVVISNLEKVESTVGAH